MPHTKFSILHALVGGRMIHLQPQTNQTKIFQQERAHVRMMKRRNKKKQRRDQTCLPAWAFLSAYIVKITAN